MNNSVPVASWDVLQNAIAKGPVNVEFGKAVESCEGYIEAGMRGTIISIRDDGDDVGIVRVNFLAFEDFNRPLEKADYYDKDRRPCLTAREAGQYEPITDLYLTISMINDYLSFLDPDRYALIHEYSQLPGGTSYVQWLEDQVLSLRAAQSKGAASVE